MTARVTVYSTEVFGWCPSCGRGDRLRVGFSWWCSSCGVLEVVRGRRQGISAYKRVVGGGRSVMPRPLTVTVPVSSVEAGIWSADQEPALQATGEVL